MNVFVDSSGFIGLLVEKDKFHKEATEFLAKSKQEGLSFITSNFILCEVYDYLRGMVGKDIAVSFYKFLASDLKGIKLTRVFTHDEKLAWKYFVELPGRGTSFTDCTSFAVMKRLGLKDAFTFDQGFRKAGFKMVP